MVIRFEAKSVKRGAGEHLPGVIRFNLRVPQADAFHPIFMASVDRDGDLSLPAC